MDSQSKEGGLNVRHAAALALVVWSLWIPEVGSTVPQDCPDCAVTLEARAEFARPFKTKAECEKAGQDWLRDFYADARKNKERVVFPPESPVCTKAAK